jgi:hypothetical protein
MGGVSLVRLYLLRAVYLLIGTALVVQIGPRVLRYHGQWELMEGVVQCMLLAFGLLCVLGVRYPVRMLPVLLWELGWKVLWLLVVALPQWRAGTLTADLTRTVFDCMVVVIVPLALPWGYVVDKYVRTPGDRWGRGPRAVAPDAVQ